MNPNPTYYQRREIANNQTAFMFDSMSDYKRFIDDVTQVATGNCLTGINYLNGSYIADQIRSSGGQWFGTNDVNEVSNIQDYLFNTNLENELEVLRNNNIRFDKTDLDQQKSLVFTEREIGIFSFDLASLGLIPVYEYYSPVLKKIVSGNLIKGEKNAEKKIVFYHIYQPEIPEHIVRYNTKFNGYYSEILGRIVEKNELVEENNNFIFPYRAEIQKHIVEQRHKLDKKGKKMFTSTFKKCFIDIPKIEKPLPRIDIIIGIAYPYDVDSRTEMMYNSVAALSVAEKLSRANVQYRILGCFAGECSRDNDKKFFGFVTLKKEGEILNKNQLAITISDGRFYRYEGFKGRLCLQFDAGYDRWINPTGISVPIRDRNVIKRAYMDFLSTSTNLSDLSASQRADTKISFAGSNTMREAQNEYDTVIQQISTIT